MTKSFQMKNCFYCTMQAEVKTPILITGTITLLTWKTLQITMFYDGIDV